MHHELETLEHLQSHNVYPINKDAGSFLSQKNTDFVETFF